MASLRHNATPKTEATWHLMGAEIERRMREKGISIAQMAERVDATYETMRRILRGMNLPSVPRLRMICAELEWNLDEALEMRKMDQVRSKFGSVEVGGVLRVVDPDLERMVNDWDTLSSAQKEVVVAQFEVYRAMNSDGSASHKASAVATQ